MSVTKGNRNATNDGYHYDVELTDEDIALIEAQYATAEAALAALAAGVCSGVQAARHALLSRKALTEGFSIPAGTVPEQNAWGITQGHIA